MNAQEIIASNLAKAEKARRLYDLGYTRHQVAEIICGGNYGWAHNLYKKHFNLETRTRVIAFAKEFGVEIEGYGVGRNQLADLLNAAGINARAEGYNHITGRSWKVVMDGSIRGENSFELVSPILKGEQGLEELKKVCDVLSAAGAQVNHTCGMHVHFNARQMNINDWKNLYKNYVSVEAEIDNMMPASRRGDRNTYCKSIMHRYTSKENLFTAIDNATTVQQLSQAVTGRDRYYKLNAESFERHGTVEFRQHSGTVEFKKISSWVRICSAMIDRSKTGVMAELTECVNTELKTYIRDRKQKFAA